MNDNRMDPQERNKYWTRNVAVPGGAVCYMTMADARWMVLAFVVFICGMLQFIWSEHPTYIRISMPLFIALLGLAGAASLFDAVAASLLTGGMLFWRFYDFRRVNNSRTLPDLLKTDRGQVYFIVGLLFVAGVAMTMVKYYIPLHFG
jgi:hypothetical protein